VFYEGECYLCKIWFGTNPNRKPLPVHDKFVLDVAALPVLETPAEAVFCDHSQWRECAATLEMVRDLSDKALNYTAAYDLANDLAAILAGHDDAIPGAPVEPVPAPRRELTRDALADAMNEAFAEFCADTGCAPDCFQIHGPRTSSLSADFRVGNFVNFVIDILSRESAPVPAPRLEWLGDEETGHLAAHGVGNVWQIIGFPFFTDGETFRLSTAAHLARGSVEDLQELAQRLQDVIEFFEAAPPVGTQEKEN
jgi:hypothetical protein